METLGESEDGANVTGEMESWHQLPVEEDPSQFLGQTSGLLEADGLQGITLNTEGQMTIIRDSNMQPAADKFESLQLELQDSCLSPALTLIPQGKTFLPSESTLLHQTDLEFVPLRGSPDLSTAFERCPQMSRLNVEEESNLTYRSHEQASLSQHPLGMMSAIFEDVSSCCSLSQHSLSQSNNCQATQIRSPENNDEWKKEGEGKNAVDSDGRPTMCSLNSGFGVTRSSEVKSSSKTVFSQRDAVLSSPDIPEGRIKQSDLGHEQNSACTSTKESHVRQCESREQPQGGSSSLSSQRRTMGGDVSVSSRLSAISNITVRSKSKQADDISDLPLKLHSDSSLSLPGGRNQTQNKNSPIGQNITPDSEGGVFVAGLQRALWNLGSQPAADGSFLTSKPVFQSTPAVLLGRGAQASAKLSPVYSIQDTVATSTQNCSPKPDDIPPLTLSTTSCQSINGVTLANSLTHALAHTESRLQHKNPQSQEASSPRSDMPVIGRDDTPLDQPTLPTLLSTSDQQLKDQEPRLSTGKVHSLPSLSYVQKVDAWNTNQRSSRSFYNNLSLHGFDFVPQRKEQESVSVTVKQQSQQPPRNPSPVCNANNSAPTAQTGSGVLSCADVEVAVRSTSPSPFTHSHSHSSLGTVLISVQQDKLQLNQNQLPLDVISPGVNSTAAESSLSSSGTSDHRPVNDPGIGRVKTSALLSEDRYSDMNLNTNTSNRVSGFPDRFHGEQSFQASLGASSVVSLEVDNYAPYWTSRPGSPPHPPEFNIEDRIPIYLKNLGISQSPSKILNPFTHRGPIREPEFSPTDLCTIKGSVETPTKSIQPFDADSLQKDTFSSSSVLSANSSASLTQLCVQTSVQQATRPASSGSTRMTGSLPEPHTPLHSVPQGANNSHREGSYGLPAEENLEAAAAPVTWEGVKEGDSSLVGSGTLQEIRRLLGHAESLVSGHLSKTSSHGSHYCSENDASFLSLRRDTKAYHDDSYLSVDGKISLVLARSSSDSALKESFSSSSGLLQLSAKSDNITNGPSTPFQAREENPKSRDFRVAPRRAEPEGCSAADPDSVGPMSLPITQGNASSKFDGQQQSQDNTVNSVISSSEQSPSQSQAEAEAGVLSDASSEHSLASRVAKLLKSESSVSVVTSQSSTADPVENQAREWIMMKVSGGKCETLDLNAEDRRRIEEIKRELLLSTKHTKSGSDSETSTQSSVGTVPQPAIGFAAMRSAEAHLSEQLQRVSRLPLDSSVPLHKPLEDRVSQFAIKEGGGNTQHTPTLQSASQCLHTHNSHASQNDLAIGSNSYSTLKSSEEWKLTSQMTSRATKNEGGMGTVGKENELRDEHPEIRGNGQLPTTEAAHTISQGKQEFTQGLESSSTIGQKPHLSNSHIIPSVKSKHTIQRPHTPASDTCTFSELQSGSNAHNLDNLKEVPPPVSSTSEVQHSQVTLRYPQAFTPPRRLGPSRPLLANAAAVPTLLPYKPHGSSELFYMPKTVPELSPNPSDTTVESSHTGSDDAVPPQFTPEVLGSRELVDNNVTPKHKEGIYSKRAKMKRASTLSGKVVHDQRGNTVPPYHPPAFRKSVVVPENDQMSEQIEVRESFIPLRMEADYSTTELHPSYRVQKHNMGTETWGKDQDMKGQDLGAEIVSSLDQLWRRFNERCSLQETQSSNDVELSLLDRLERLSRLLHGSSPQQTPEQACSSEEKDKSGRREQEPRRTQGKDTTRKRKEKKIENEVKGVPKTAWEQETLSINRALVEKKQQENDCCCPTERDGSGTVSVNTSSSQSTIDTQRLIRAFGPHRVRSGRDGVTLNQTLHPDDGLMKLYSTIKKQKRGHHKGGSENHLVSVSTETSNIDDSLASDTLSSSSPYTLPSKRGNGRTRAKVKLVSRSIQTGDLEIVVNGTRRDTRDVGTTFPSPGSTRTTRASSAACSEVKSQPVLKRQAPAKQTRYPTGLSWFVSADELKWDEHKENKPQTIAGWSEGQAWYEPYTRTQPWREPLRERHIQVEREKPPEQKTHSENDCDKPSALVRLSLQEALELHRPEFVSRSRERMKRLCLLTEERRMQAVFSKEREELFNRAAVMPQPKAAPAPPPLPSKRVIPICEMIQRSKRIYAQLPEVQKRKEEERRKAEYNTYRLNAQLFNKKITNRVLGRRVPWQ